MSIHRHDVLKKRVVHSIFMLSILSGFIAAGCTPTPLLTTEDRRRDIEFLTRWARNYSPLVELNEKYKGTPSYEALLPKYLEFAEQVRSNEEFYQVVSGYFNVIGASGHAYLVPDNYLKWDALGYIRVRSFMGSPLDFVFKHFIKRDRTKIRAFLERSHGKYDKLIIDVRQNSGGDPAYFYDNLIRPFLNGPVTYEYTTGLKRRFLEDTNPSVLRQLRKTMVPEHVIDRKETTPPEGFDAKEWVFYRITRRLEPARRFAFTGDTYILVNGGCFSACDDYVSTVKRIGIATLVGQTTSGAGGIGYCMTPFVRLPQSGMIFALDVHLPLNPDGSFTALHGLEPDIKLPDADVPRSITKEDLLKDERIKRVIAEP